MDTFAFASWSAWQLGRVDVARDRLAQARAAADPTNPYQVACSGMWAAVLQAELREYEQAEALAAQALAHAEQHQFPQAVAWCRCTLGCARAHLGRTAEGVALIRQGIADAVAIGFGLGMTYSRPILARAQACAGAVADALATVEQALQANPDERYRRPENLRLRGELRLTQGRTELAAADFREAIALACRMGAKAWELRATVSLARLLAQDGQRDDARTMLAEVYGSFTEGFDTVDLKEAKALLEELR